MLAVLILLLMASTLFCGAPKRFKQIEPSYRSVTKFQTNMTVLSGTGGVSTTSSRTWTGTQSNLLTVGATSVSFIIAVSPAVNICADEYIAFTFFEESKAHIMDMNDLSIVLGNNTSNYIGYTFGSSQISDSLLTNWPSWNKLFFNQREFATVGVFDCASVDTVILAFQAETGLTSAITVGEISTYNADVNKATLIITADDELDGWIHGIKKLDTLRRLDGNNYRSTMMINSGRLGENGFMSFGKIDSLYRLGLIDIGNQNTKDDTLSIRSIDSAYNTMKHNYEFIRSKGWCCPSLYSYSYGAKSHGMDSAFRKSGLVDFARITRDNVEGEPQQFGDPYSLKIGMVLANTVTVSQAVSAVDRFILNKSVGIALAHTLSIDGTVNSFTWRQAYFSEFMDSVKTRVNAGTLRVISLGDYLSSYGGGVTNRQRSGLGRR